MIDQKIIIRQAWADYRGPGGWELWRRKELDGIEIEDKWGMYDTRQEALSAALKEIKIIARYGQGSK